jgi:PTH1 family peptidyl-tRNA hydrolase
MNDSGTAVGGAARFYKLEPSEVLVVHDEGDFDLGRLELKVGGGLSGHNGLRSIAQHLKTQDFLRLRVGVGRPERGDPRPLADYVLSNFQPHDEADTLVARAADAVEQLDADGIEQAQRAVNRR